MRKHISADTIGLSEFMCFSIYSANLAYSRVYKPVLEKLGVTYPQYITLIALWENDNQTVKGLSERLFLEPSTMTPMLKRLEAMGYVTRTRGIDDERIVRITLTQAGRLLREKGIPLAEITFRGAGLTPEAFARLQRDISQMRDNLMQASKAAALAQA